ncbi:MAG: helix-turn-helix domain-containing protein [Rikenellaceae bacterium]|nr:helix-turn-helix domain-containing protein [Rikenellaceae bacterium]
MTPISLKNVTARQIFDIVGGRCDQSGEFSVNTGFPPNETFIENPFRSPAAVVMLALGGRTTARINLTTHVLTRGTVLIYGEGSIVNYPSASDDARYHILLFTHRYVQEMMIDFMSVIPIFKYIVENIDQQLQVSEDEVDILSKYFELFYGMAPSYSRPVMRDLFASFIRTLGDMYNRRLDEKTTARSRQEEYFEKFILKVTEHHYRERSVRFYADELHITPKYLSTVIKDVSGRSAASWINEFVINRAKILLKFSGKSVQEITYELNFSTQSFFGKFFKRHTGISPSDYRKAE